jgi:hypothetical protein
LYLTNHKKNYFLFYKLKQLNYEWIFQDNTAGYGAKKLVVDASVPSYFYYYLLPRYFKIQKAPNGI